MEEEREQGRREANVFFEATFFEDDEIQCLRDYQAITLISRKDITAGEELFVVYGNKFLFDRALFGKGNSKGNKSS